MRGHNCSSCMLCDLVGCLIGLSIVVIIFVFITGFIGIISERFLYSFFTYILEAGGIALFLCWPILAGIIIVLAGVIIDFLLSLIKFLPWSRK